VTPKRLFYGLIGYGVALVIACAVVHATYNLTIDEGRPRAVIASVWKRGQLLERVVLPSLDAKNPQLDSAAHAPGAALAFESIVGEGPILTHPEAAFALSIVSGHDGVVAKLGGTTVYVTPDDLLARQAFDHGLTLSALGLTLGLNVPVVYAILAERLHTSAPEVAHNAELRRIRVTRTIPQQAPSPASVVTPASLTRDAVREAALDAARYLARGVRDDGHLRYLVDAPTNRDLPGYDWPRHAGATYFLAQAAALSHEGELSMACLRAAALLRDHAVSDCGGNPCIGDGTRVDVGSTALATIAFVEIARTGLDPTYAQLAAGLSKFLMAQQRPDGEFMHEYDRATHRPIDVQYLYYSGEATLALSRVHSLAQEPAALDAARRGLSHLVGPAWRFFGNRYFFGEEHWTCQAMADLWDRAADPAALDFCVRWQRFGRKMMFAPGDAVYDVDGSYGVGPLLTPRLTPVASRCEAGVATLGVLRRPSAPVTSAFGEAEALALDAQLHRSLALLLRQQLRPGPAHLFVNPAAMYGAMPGSEVDLQARIDYAQHAGSAMIRWLEVTN
jgi:hypothetical protein